MPTLVAGERLKHTRLLSRPRGQLRISCLSLQLRLILLAQRLVEARRAGPAHRLRAVFFPRHEEIERAEPLRVAAFVLRKAQQPLPRALRPLRRQRTINCRFAAFALDHLRERFFCQARVLLWLLRLWAGYCRIHDAAPDLPLFLFVYGNHIGSLLPSIV